VWWAVHLVTREIYFTPLFLYFAYHLSHYHLIPNPSNPPPFPPKLHILPHPLAIAVVIGVRTESAEDNPRVYIITRNVTALAKYRVARFMAAGMNNSHGLRGGVRFIAPGELKYGGNGKVVGIWVGSPLRLA